MPGMKLPYFENEAAEAQWWYDHREEISDQLVTAIREGRTGEGSVARYARKVREAEMVEATAGELPGTSVKREPLRSAEQ